MTQPETLTAVLAIGQREDRQVIFIDGDDNQRAIPFARLRTRALGLLGAIARRGATAGDAVVLFVNDNERFLEMFWACVLGGLVPVPLSVGIGEEHRRKLFRVFGRFDRAWVYSDAKTLDRLDTFAAAQGLTDRYETLKARTWLTGTLDTAGAPGVPVARTPDDIAFIQYSSGSTSEPKGVVLTHRNLCANIASIRVAAAFTDRDVALSWMPLSHDMGLIGFHLNMLACGATHAIMSTALFARRPLLWLSKATELKATVLCSPNFGYQHYLKQYEGKGRPSGLDLSAVRLVFNGAEPVAADLCERFTRTMGAHGLGPRTMYPVYGLAEASLAVTFPKPGAPVEVQHLDRAAFRVGEPVRRIAPGEPAAAAFVKLGQPVPGTQLRIAGDGGEPLPAGTLGHVQVRGDNVTRGYWRDEMATSAARTADGWLDTGDLGFLDGGDLVVAGRAKDVVFVNGQNYYPHDLEGIAATVPGLEINRVVAAGVRNPATGTEDLTFFLLTRGDPAGLAPIARELRRTIGQQTALEIGRIVPVTRVPKTTSGKLARHLLVTACEDGEFAEAERALAALLETRPAAEGESAPAAGAGTAARLKAICDAIIPEKRVAPTTNLLEINLNSLTLARIHEGIDREFPNRLEVTDLFDHPTLAELAAFLDTGKL